jgi:hypothetical protein
MNIELFQRESFSIAKDGPVIVHGPLCSVNLIIINQQQGIDLKQAMFGNLTGYPADAIVNL